MVKIHTESLNHDKNVTFDQFLNFSPFIYGQQQQKLNRTPVLGDAVSKFHWTASVSRYPNTTTTQSHWHNRLSSQNIKVNRTQLIFSLDSVIFPRCWVNLSNTATSFMSQEEDHNEIFSHRKTSKTVTGYF